ncbi:putative transmembrane sensor domain protein [Leptolyngbyaceae cyanobacterium JSC-12]|nr:putative transmembrane sensor domain protein [Leptolyngbyaceae cyanobacterium JSC-12]
MNWRFRKHGWRFLPGGAIALGVAVLLKLGVFQPLEQIVYQSLLNLRGTYLWDDRLVLVTIDDASIQQIGRFPWSRQQYVELLNVLAKADASVVTLNLVFSESSPEDAALARAMTQYGRVILAQANNGAEFKLSPVATLQTSAIATGHILRTEDSDGITRSIPTSARNVPTLGVATVQAYSLVREKIPIDYLGDRLWINWVSPVRNIPQYSFVDVIRGKFPAQAFRNKIVLVGVTARAIDPLITPYDRNPPASGVHLHATVINNLLQHNSLWLCPRIWLPFLLLVGGPGFNLVLSRYRTHNRILIWLIVCLAWVTLSAFVFRANVWIPVAMPLTLFTATAIAVNISQQLRLNALLQQQIQHLWQTYHADLVTHRFHRSHPTTLRPEDEAISSERVEQLAALAEQFGRSQSTQAAIAHSLPIGLLAADLDGVVWFCNPVAAEWLNVQLGDQLTAHLVPEWLDETQWHISLQTLQQTKLSPILLQRGDRWYELKLEPLIYTSSQLQASEPDGLLLVLTDFTLQKQAEATLENQVNELHRLNQLKDDFLSTVPHELQSPMASIQMAIELLKISKSPESTERYLKILQDECTREVNLINDLLDLQRLEAGTKTFTAEPIVLANWLPTVIEDFYKRAEARQQKFQLELAPQLPVFISDQASLQRVMVELVNNACKYTPPNEEIKVSASSTTTHIELVVSNSGSKISQNELPWIFEKFYRVPQSDPWKRRGTGLGLALVKKLVERLGGSITVSSDSRQTTFIVSLPIAGLLSTNLQQSEI